MRMRVRLRGTAAFLVGTLLAGCAWIGGGGTGEIPHPGGDALVLRVATSGGFVPAEYHLTDLPSFTLLGDGRVIVTGATPAIYPGPLLPSLRVRRLNERGIQSVLETVLRTGQLDAGAQWSGANRRVADAPDTVFELHADGRDVTVRVYALGIVDGEMSDVSEEERAAHLALGQLLDDLDSLDTWIGSAGWVDAAWQPYEAEALRLLVRVADGERTDPSGLAFDERPWPSSAADPATFGDEVAVASARCGVVSEPAALDWYDVLADATQLTRWVADGHRYVVAVRPLLPDEARACTLPA